LQRRTETQAPRERAPYGETVKRSNVLNRKPMFELPLRDKPIGYSCGQSRIVSACPVCKAHGLLLRDGCFVHTLTIVEVDRLKKEGGIRRELEVSRDDACRWASGQRVPTEGGC